MVYGNYATEELAAQAQARWQLTGLLPEDDPELAVEVPASVAVGGVRCDKWFERWQEAKLARRSRIRVNTKRGGAASTAARDRAQWSKWWSPAVGSALPHVVSEDDLTGVLRKMQAAGRAPNTIRTHWTMVKAFLRVAGRRGRAPVEPAGLNVGLGRPRGGSCARDRGAGLPVRRDVEQPVGGGGPVDLRAPPRDRRPAL